MERQGLFTTEKHGGRALYRLHAVTVFLGICLLLCYRATHVPAAGTGRAAWLGMLAAELCFAFYWVITQSVRWCPIRRRTFVDRLAARFVCMHASYIMIHAYTYILSVDICINISIIVARPSISQKIRNFLMHRFIYIYTYVRTPTTNQHAVCVNKGGV